MIVDVHYHLIPMLPEEMIEELVEIPMRMARAMKKPINKQAMIEQLQARNRDKQEHRIC